MLDAKPAEWWRPRSMDAFAIARAGDTAALGALLASLDDPTELINAQDAQGQTL
jgi:hypothetical protein